MNYKKIILFTYISIMIVFFIISTTNLVIDEDYKKVYEISVIFDDENSDKYDKLKLGIEDSILDLSVDINYVYLENQKNQVKEQEDDILREISKGVDGIVIIPTNPNEIGNFIDTNGIKTPMISIDQKINCSRNISVVTTDYEELGNKIAEDIVRKYPDKNVVAFSKSNDTKTNTVDSTEISSENMLYNSMSRILENKNIKSQIIYYTDDNFTKNVNQFEKEKTVFVSLDAYTTQKFIDEYINDEDITNGNSQKYSYNDDDNETIDKMILYGFGYNSEFINNLVLEKIEALGFYDEYLLGYLSVRNLIYDIDGKFYNKNVLIPNYLVFSDDVYDYENILFPIY